MRRSRWVVCQKGTSHLNLKNNPIARTGYDRQHYTSFIYCIIISFFLSIFARERYCVTLYTLAGSLIQFISLFSLSFFSDVSVTRLVDRNHERTKVSGVAQM